MSGERKERRCVSCSGHGLIPIDSIAIACLRNGLRAGMCGDWIVCEDCGGTGTFVVYEHKITPPKVFVMR